LRATAVLAGIDLAWLLLASCGLWLLMMLAFAFCSQPIGDDDDDDQKGTRRSIWSIITRHSPCTSETIFPSHPI